MRSKQDKLPLPALLSSFCCWTKPLSPRQITKNTLASVDVPLGLLWLASGNPGACNDSSSGELTKGNEIFVHKEHRPWAGC